MDSRGFKSFIWLILGAILCAPAWAQSPHMSVAAAGLAVPAGEQAEQQIPGTVTGTIVDTTGAAIGGARVALTSTRTPPNREMQTGVDGQFSFANIVPGPFQITVMAAGFTTQSYSGVLKPGEFCVVPAITMPVAPATSNVVVTPPREEIAEEQIKEEEKQRVFGIIPNFYVSYVPNAAPLDSKQKFELAWKSTIDPVTFVFNGAVAGIEQAGNEFGAYGEGAQGYAKRYGAAYGDLVTGNFLEGWAFPSLLKQDPRYFYKGSGSTRSRILYAIANSVICKGDNGRWQANYSGILGSLASGGISNLYYPAQYRGVALTFENTLVGIAEGAATNLFEEFLIPKLTPHLSIH